MENSLEDLEDMDKPIGKMSTADITEGRIRTGIFYACREMDKEPYTTRYIYAHSEDGDEDKGVFDKVQVEGSVSEHCKFEPTVNNPILRNAKALETVLGDNFLMKLAPVVETPFEDIVEVAEPSDGDLIVTGEDQQNQKVYEFIRTKLAINDEKHHGKKLEAGTERTELRRRPELDEEVQRGHKILDNSQGGQNDQFGLR